jgi:hypothetical protein
MTAEAEKLISDLMDNLQEKCSHPGKPVTSCNVYMGILNPEKTFMDEDEAKEFCNVGKTIFRKAVNLRLIPYCIFPGSSKKLFHRETLEKAIKSNRHKGLKSERLLA